MEFGVSILVQWNANLYFFRNRQETVVAQMWDIDFTLCIAER